MYLLATDSLTDDKEVKHTPNPSTDNLVLLWNTNTNTREIVEKSEKFPTFYYNERKEANVSE